MIGQTLGHYRIVEQIGSGGMGVVYRARDDRLDRDVALKILPAGALADDAGRKRFRKEAVTLSKLNHPHIAMVYDFDAEGGVDYLAMEYVPGETLQEKLTAGALPEKEAARLAEQVAAALEEAHEQGVVHRDLKPGNILVTPKGQAKVLDFGIAKLLRPVSAATTESFSETQAAAGTLPYMAPEQLRGEPADARADIFALGAVLYEMATGRRAFPEELATRLADSILHQPPVAPRAVNARVSPELERLILKCLEKDPDQRYQSAKELAVDLRRLGSPSSAATLPGAARARPRWQMPALTAGISVAVLLVVLFGLNVGGWRSRLVGRAPSARIESLAVLPLENFSRDPEQEYFAEGMTEALITDLAKIGALRVISRTSVMQYKGVKKPLPQIAKELNVDAVVEGSVQRSGDRVRITAQLIEAPTDRHLWAESYERDLRDVLALQDEVARAIATEIKIKLTPQEQVRLASARPVNPEAFQLYLKGRYHWNKRTEEGLKKSVVYFQQAIEKDPGYAAAYSGLADSYLSLFDYDYLPAGEATPKARAAALKALEIDNRRAEAHNSLAHLSLHEWNWPDAEREFKRAIELDPSYVLAHHWYALCLTAMGRLDEAIAEVERAQELDPLSVRISADVGMAYFAARKYDRAIEQERKTLELDPNARVAHWISGLAYEQKGMLEEAIKKFEEVLGRSPGNPNVLASLGHAYAVAGKKREARKVLDVLREQSKRSQISPFFIALVYTGLGEKDQAFAWLEKAYQERSGSVRYLKVEPRLDPLRLDPRFQDLLRRVGLPP